MTGDLWKAALLGIVEGATEFIPVSSTGHLIVVSDWLDFGGERAKTFDIFIQLGAILAVVWLYRSTFVGLVRGLLAAGPARRLPAWRLPARRLAVALALAFLPAAVVGVLTHDLIKRYLFGTVPVALALVVGGILILLIERLAPAPRVHAAEDIAPRTAFGIGLAQVLSLVPGTSRSAATIMGGYLLGLSRKAATEFSFFLAVPVMLAATLFEVAKSRDALSAADIPVFGVGFVVSFVTAVIVVKAFIAFVGRRSFRVFGWYRIVVGAALLIGALVGAR